MNKLNNVLENFTSPWENFSDYVSDYIKAGKEEIRKRLETSLQKEISNLEANLSGTIRKKDLRYFTMFGEIRLKVRVYGEKGNYFCPAQERLKLPKDRWLKEVEKYATELGLLHEFAHAHKIFSEHTGIQISERGLANRVEEVGQDVYQELKQSEEIDTNLVDSVLTSAACKNNPKEIIYAEVDGTMVPIKKEGYKEAKVGIIFSEREHFKISPKRRIIRKKEYVTSMESRTKFGEIFSKRFSQIAGSKAYQVVFIGDGAPWIWNMASQYFPNAIEILDFYHVSEYVWSVAREAFPEQAENQKQWANRQLDLLKESRADELELKFDKKYPELKTSIDTLKRYLKNNKSRIDYKTYLEKGLMIGSGVIESSNKKIVSQRLKQPGMFWSRQGANYIMALRTAYFSDSDFYKKFWNNRVA